MSAPGSWPCWSALLAGSTTSTATDCAVLRKGMASAIARRASRLAFQPTRMLLPIVSDFQPSGMIRTGTPLAIRSRFRRPALWQSRRGRGTDDHEIAMERIQYRVVIGAVAPDHPEFRTDTLLQRKRCKEAVNREGFLFLG